MADALRISEKVIGGGVIQDTTTGQSQAASYGRAALPASTFSLTHGTGTGQANKWYLAQRTLANGASDNLDLAGGLTDYKGAAITFTAIKRVYVAIVSPDGTKSLRVGPQNVANAGTFWWGGTGATVYATVVTDFDMKHPYGGWTVTAGTGDIFPIVNQSGVSVTYALWIVGVG